MDFYRTTRDVNALDQALRVAAQGTDIDGGRRWNAWSLKAEMHLRIGLAVKGPRGLASLHQADGDFARGIELNGKDLMQFLMRAQVRGTLAERDPANRERHLEGALGDIQSALALDHRHARCLYRLARIRNMRGERALALEAVRQALEHNPDEETRPEAEALLRELQAKDPSR